MLNKLKRTAIAACILTTVCVKSAGAQSFRAPAYPLITHDPYFSIWSFTDELSQQTTTHWTGKTQTLVGLARVDGKAYRFLGNTTPVYNTLLATAETAPANYRYTTTAPAGEWQQNNYTDKTWKLATGAFSDEPHHGQQSWKTPELWVRRSFTLAEKPQGEVFLHLFHDDNVEVYINGIKAYSHIGWLGEYKDIPLPATAVAALQKGKNTIAVYIKNTAGGAYLDFGLRTKKEEAETSTGTATQTGVTITATQTKYNFTCGPVKLDVAFTSPLLMDKLDILSRPASYITFTAASQDGKAHQVEVLLGAGSDIAVNVPSQPVTTQQLKVGNLNVLKAGTKQQEILRTKGDDVRIDWGYLYTAVQQGAGQFQSIAPATIGVQQFIRTGRVQPIKILPANAGPLLLTNIWDLGKVDAAAVKKHMVLAYDDIYSVAYFGKPLKAWWRKDPGMNVEKMLEMSMEQYQQLMAACQTFDASFEKQMLAAGGKKYAELTTLAYRQSIAAHKAVVAPDGKLFFFSKENFSNGSIGTVDITYPSSPLYLLYNPIYLKGMMEPIFDYSESGRWTKPFAAHDVGTYPLANGQTYGEDMPVEESGNMLLLTTAIATIEGNADYAKSHWNTLTTWAAYLEKEGLDPANQLCTDDFAGHLAHNANLSVKAILGLAGYGKLAGQLGKKDIAEKYTALAKEMADKWMQMATDGDHYSLTFDKKNTWSQKYNLVWDELLQLNIFPPDVAAKEIRYYVTKQQPYGLPLDSRKTYTKSDWILWTATMTKNTADFNTLLDPVYHFVTGTPDRIPLSDWHETTDGKSVGFRARSVVGGFFMPALKVKLEK
jgi:hypothetical protein